MVLSVAVMLHHVKLVEYLPRYNLMNIIIVNFNIDILK